MRPEPRSTTVGVAVAIYRALVRLLPPSFAPFREPAVADFEAVAERERARGGRTAVVAALLRAAADLVVRAPVEWRRSRRVSPREEAPWRVAARELSGATRSLIRRPFFSTVVLATLVVGIGAAVTIFTVVDAILIRPLPYPESGRIVTVRHHAPGIDLPELGNSGGIANFYRASSRTLRGFSLVDTEPVNLTGADIPAQVEIARVSPAVFDVLRVRPHLGRAFTAEEELPGSAAVAVLTHKGWIDHFGGDPDVLGRTVEVDGTPYEVVGVMPEDFAYPKPETIALLPHPLEPDAPFGTFGRDGIARLAPGADLEDARRELDQLQARLPEAFESSVPEAFLEEARWDVSVTTLRDRMVEDVRTALWVVLGTVGFLLLVACANVTNLFIVRAETGRREVAIRQAMGAGRGRLLLRSLSESLVLSLLAGVVGLAIAALAAHGLTALGPRELPRLHEVAVGGRTALFTLGLCTTSAIVFGGVPALRTLSGSFSVLRDGARGATDGPVRQRTRTLLVATQLAFALVLLVGSGLMLRSFQGLRSVDPGVDPEGVLLVGVSVGEHRERDEAAAFYQRLIEEARGLPGVLEVGAANSVPLIQAGMNGGSFHIESKPRAEGEISRAVMNAAVAGAVFEALDVPVVLGRGVRPADHEGGPPVAWVNEAFVHTFLGKSDPLTERIAFSSDGDFMRIAGVVGDTRHFGLDEEIQPLVYVPMTGPGASRAYIATMLLVLETDLEDPLALVPAVRELAAGIDRSVPVLGGRTLERAVRDSMADTSFTLVLLAVAAAAALLIGAIGVYGVIAYVVSQRTREIGVRMALGADRSEIRAMVVRQGMVVTAVGVGAGLVGAYGLTRVMESLLFEVSARDPVTFALVTTVLAAVAALASYLPARRASAVDPVRALRAS